MIRALMAIAVLIALLHCASDSSPVAAAEECAPDTIYVGLPIGLEGVCGICGSDSGKVAVFTENYEQCQVLAACYHGFVCAYGDMYIYP